LDLAVAFGIALDAFGLVSDQRTLICRVD